ncbi:MAG: NAD-dependent epimerase/dehydratase family protein [Gemmatimonadota bacterium]|nr:NAD-dependent epimerase/dehydratase family protein [Gemmatimonadota bacterium]
MITPPIVPGGSAPGGAVEAIDIQSLITADLDTLIDRAEPEFSALAGQVVWFTGAAGFLGYYLCKAIDRWNLLQPADRQIRLLAIDNFQRGVPAWLGELRSPGIEVVRHDVVEPVPAAWPAPAYIIHGASIASPIYYRRYPIQTIDANVQGLRHMLDHAVSLGAALRGMLFFSTSEIYGDPPADQIPTRETFRGLVSSTGPRACYDESKRLGETLCVVFAEQHGVPVSIARPFNNYGPGLKLQDGRVLPDFARNALAGEDIVLLSDGSPTRTFCYITDALAGYLKVLVRGERCEPYNIGLDTGEISMADLAHLVARQARELWGYPGRVIQGQSAEAAYLTDNPNRRCPDIAKARAHLEFRPEVGVEEGLRQTLVWYWYHRDGQEA